MLTTANEAVASISRVAQRIRSVNSNLLSSQSAVSSNEGRVAPILTLGANIVVDKKAEALERIRAARGRQAQDSNATPGNAKRTPKATDTEGAKSHVNPKSITPKPTREITGKTAKTEAKASISMEAIAAFRHQKNLSIASEVG